MLWFAVSTASLWYGTRFLLVAEKAQPIELMFEEQASYCVAHWVADTILFFVSLFGLILKLHEPTFETDSAMACVAAWSCMSTCPILGGRLLVQPAVQSFYAVVSSPESDLWGVSFPEFVQGRGTFEKKIICGCLCNLFPLACYSHTSALLRLPVTSSHSSAQTQADTFGLLNPSEIGWFVKHFAWYLCPAWPLAIWRFGSGEGEHSARISSYQQSSSRSRVYRFRRSPPRKSHADFIAAAFGLTAYRRSMQAMLDYFALAVFSLATISRAMGPAGFPPKMARSVINLAPDATL